MIQLALQLILVMLPASGQPAETQDQEFAFQLLSSHDDVQIAEPFVVRFMVHVSAGTSVQFPDFGEQLGPFEIVAEQNEFDLPVAGGPNQRQWARSLTLETLETGIHEIPSMEIALRLPSGEQRVIRTESHLINVSSVLEQHSDSRQFHDIRGVVDIVDPSKQPSYTWMLWAAGGVLGLVAACGVVVVAKRRRQSIVAADWAVAALTSDSCRDIAQVDEILRTFIANEFGIPALNLAAPQIWDQLQGYDVGPDLMDQLREILNLADQVKFAELPMTTDEFAATRQQAVNVVQQFDAFRRGAM